MTVPADGIRGVSARYQPRGDGTSSSRTSRHWAQVELKDGRILRSERCDTDRQVHELLRVVGLER